MSGFKFPYAGYKDWRTNEGYWECIRCGKVKDFGFTGIPRNYFPD
jgi:hypothetical protein